MSIHYERVLQDSFDYTSDALWGRWVRWLQLIVCVIIFPLLFGYFVRIMRGDTLPPELGGWGRLFVDGLKLLVIYLVYVGIIILVAMALIAGAGILGGIGSTTYVVCAIVVGVFMLLVWLVAQMAAVRFSKEGSLREAFNISAVSGHIRAIGWGSYILSQIILQIVLAIVAMVVGFFAVIFGILGFLLIPIFMLVVYPAIYIFQYRYNTLVYESAAV
jgi:hypothetical protein